jgi:recombination protein RecT
MADQNQFLALIDSRADEIRALLPKYLTPERFFTLARLVERDRNLAKCTPQSLFDCVLKAAQCGLEIGTVDQHAYIIPYGTEAQFQPSYRGMIFRLVQAGVVANMYAEVICENDPPPRIISGSQRQLVHEFAVGKRGKTVGAYAVATMPNGSTDFELMDEEGIASIEKAALRISGGKPSPAWAMFRNEMIKKSVIKRMAKRLQGDRRGLMKDDEATRLDLTFAATQRETGDEPIDDIPDGTDGTKAPTPRKARSVEVVPDKPKEDRLLNDTEQSDVFDQYCALSGLPPAKASKPLGKFLEGNFKVDDLAQIKLSQLQDLAAKMQEALTQ